MYAADNNYQQNIAINFTGDDNVTEVIDKITESVTGLQGQVFAANAAMTIFNGVTQNSIPVLNKYTAALHVADGVFQQAFNAASFAKVFAQLHSGFEEATHILEGFTTGLTVMSASGYSPKIIKDFEQLGSAIALDKEALDGFTLNAITAYNQFAKAKTEVEVLFKPGEDFVKNLSTNIQNLVNNDLKNSVSSIQALGAAYQAASAGFINAADNTAVMTSGLKLAKAGGAETGTVMKVLTQTIRAYGLQAQDADKVAAVLNKTVQLGITTIPELSNGFAQVAVTAKQAGVTIQELGAATASLTIKGFDTASAFTDLQSLFGVILSKTPEATEALANLRDEEGKAIRFDVSEIKAAGKDGGDGLAKEIDKINKAAKGNQEIIKQITGSVTAYKAFLTLSANGAAQLKENTKDMLAVSDTGAKAKTALNEVFGIKINNESEKFEAIINRITEQFIQFGEQLAPFFDEGVKAVETFTKWLSSMSPETKKMIADFLIAQLTFHKVTDAIGALTGAATKAFITFQSWRFMNSLFTGEIFKQKEIITELAVGHKNLGAALLQLIGIDQTHILLQKDINNLTLNRFQKINLLKQAHVGLIPQIKQLIGIDQSHLLGMRNVTNETTRKIKALQTLTFHNKNYQKESAKLSELEKEYQHTLAKGKDIGKDVGESYAKLTEQKKAFKKVQNELKTATGTDEEQNAIQSYAEEHQKLAVAEAEFNTNKISHAKQQKEIQESLNKVNEQSSKVDDVATGIKKRGLSVENQRVKVNDLNEKAIKARTLATVAESQAEEANTLAVAANNVDVDLNTAATLAKEKATLLSTEAKLAETVAEEANSAAMKLKRDLYLQQEIAEGRLLIANKALGKEYVANNAITRILYADAGVAIAKFAGQTSTATISAAKSIKDLPKNIKGGLTGMWDGLVAGGTVAIGFLRTKILPVLSNLFKSIATKVPEIAGLAAIGLVVFDNWFGQAAKLRKLNEDGNKVNKETREGLVKELEILKTRQEGLTEGTEKYIKNLKAQNTEADGFHSTYEKIWGTLTGKIQPASDGVLGIFVKMGSAVGKVHDWFVKLDDKINLFKKIWNFLGKQLGEAWDNFRTDQTIASFRAVNKAIKDTQDVQLEAIKTDVAYKKGLTGDVEADKLIKAGKSLDDKTTTRINKEFNEKKTMLQGQVRGLEEQVKLFDKKLEGKKLDTPEDINKLSTSDKLVLEKKKQLEAVLEKSKKILEDFITDNTKLTEVGLQREIILKRLRENSSELIDGTKKEDIGANPLETRFRKSLRNSKDDLNDYTVKITNLIKESGKDISSIDANTVNNFDQKVATVVTNIDKLYENGYLTAKQAAKEYENVMNKSVQSTDGVWHKLMSVIDPNQYLEIAKRVDKTTKESSDFRLSILQKELDKTKALLDSGALSFIQGNKKIRQNQTEQLKEQINSVKDNINILLKDKIGNKPEIEGLYKTLDVLNAQYKVKQLEDLQGEIDDRYKIQQEGYTKEIELKKLSYEKNQITTIQFDKTNNELLKKQNLISQQQVREQINIYKNTKKDTSELNKQLIDLQIQYEDLSKSGVIKLIEDKHRLIQEGYDKDLEITKINYEKGLMDTEEYNKELDLLNKKQNLDAQNKVKEQIAFYKNTKKDTYELQKQLLDLQLGYEQIITGAYEREMTKRSKIIENELTKEKLGYQELINTIGFTITALENENKVRESRNKLLLINDQSEQARLEFSLRTTADLVKRATIEEKVNESKYKSLLIQQQIEKESLINQEKSLELSFEKQELELNIRKIENESSRKQIELDIERASNRKVQNKEELNALYLKLKSNSEENRVNGLQEKAIGRQKEIQKEILHNNLIDLDAKQQIAREGGLLDVQLSKQNIILAGYQKQAEQAKLNAQRVELEGNKVIKQQEIINKLITARLDNLNKQAQLQQISQDSIQHQYKLAEDLALTDFQKQQLARAAAQQELNALDKKQEIEQQVLNMQIKSNELAYQRQVIEQKIAEAKLSAEIKVQTAETKKILASKTATDEEKDAAKALLDAKIYEGTLQPMLEKLLEDKGKQLQQDEQISRYDLNSRQRTERQDKTVAVAKTSGLQSERIGIYGALLNNLGNEPRELNSQANRRFNKDYLNQLFNRESIPQLNNQNNLNNLPTLDQLLKTPLSKNISDISSNLNKVITDKEKDYQDSKKKQPINVTLNNTNNISVSTTGNDTTEFAKRLRDVTVETMYSIVKTTNIEIANGLN